MKFCTQLIAKLSVIAFLIFWAGGCTTPKITFSTDQKATVSIVSFSDPNGDGQILGESPQTIELTKLKSGIVKIWGKKLQTQYWVFNESVSSNTKIAIRMKKISDIPRDKDDERNDDKKDEDAEPGSNSDGKPSSARNLSYRLLLRSYFALSVGKYTEARELAEKLKQLVPKIAAPHIITGITHIQEGNNAQAKSALQIALSLDPEDSEAISLMKALR